MKPLGSGWPSVPVDGDRQQCRACKTWKPLAEFGPRPRLPRGVVATCRACENATRATRKAMKRTREMRQLRSP